MAFTNMEFIVSDINSSDLGIDGVNIVRTDSEIHMPWIGGKNIVEDRIRYRDIPYDYGTIKQPLEFTLLFSILDKQYTNDILMQLGKIFGSDNYVKFQTTDDLSKVYYVRPTSQIDLITFGNFKGWYQINLRNVTGFCFSPIEISNLDFSDLTIPQTFTIYNKSNVMHPKYNDYIYFPQLNIDLKGSATSIVLYNQSDGNRKFEMTSLSTLESLEVNNDLRQITSSTGLDRIGNLTNKLFFRLVYGVNIIQITTPAVIQVICQYPIYA